MSLEESAPKWMVDLEDKLKRIKEKKQLGHEFGAGSACTICKDDCPGLDLHFWRKICIACKCKKEDHDVPADDGNMRFEILLSKNGIKTRSGVLDIKVRASHHNNTVLKQFIKNMTLPPRKVKFDWIPPDISNELAAEYMEQLPPRKTPVTGSVGAKYRNTQIERQIPLHDISLETLQKLGPNEQKKFLEYLQNVCDNVVGQAKIQKICQKQYLESSKPYVNMPEAQHSGTFQAKDPNKVPERPDYNNGTEGEAGEMNLKTAPFSLKLPSAFIPSKTSNILQHGALVDVNPSSVSVIDDSAVTNINQLKQGSANCDSNNLLTTVPRSDDLTTSNDQGLVGKEGIDEDKLLNNVPQNTTTNLDNDSNIDNELGNINKLDSKNIDNLTGNLAKTDINSANANDESVDNQLNNGNPNYKINCQPGFDSHPTGYKPSESNFQDVSNLEKEVGAMDLASGQSDCCNDQLLPVEKPMTCAQCTKEITFGSVAVMTDRAGSDVAWHPECFVCNICQELLVDLIYFFYKGKVFCGRHYAEKLNIPRCNACDELIFVQEYTMADDKSYHVNHFCCIDCDLELAGHSYIVVDQNPVCLGCYEKNHGKECMACHKKIQATEQGVNLGKKHWHATSRCFKCVICNNSLVNQRVSISKGSLLCSSRCIRAFNEKQ